MINRTKIFKILNDSSSLNQLFSKKPNQNLQDLSFLIIQMRDLQEGLVVGKGKKSSKEYIRRFDQCELKVKTLKNKNNQLQKQCDNEMDRDIRQAIQLQASFLEKEVTDLKDLMSKLTRDFTDPASKKRIKDLWNTAGKEIQRNKRLMAEFVNRASTYPSFLKRSSQFSAHDQEQKGHRDKATNNRLNRSGDSKKEWSSLIEGEELDDGELALQKRILAEKKALLNEIQQKNNKINKLYNEMGSMLAGEQRDMLNQMEENVSSAKQNLIQANQELKEAAVEQRKSKKKYAFIVTAIIIVILVGAGIVYLSVK